MKPAAAPRWYRPRRAARDLARRLREVEQRLDNQDEAWGTWRDIQGGRETDRQDERHLRLL